MTSDPLDRSPDPMDRSPDPLDRLRRAAAARAEAGLRRELRPRTPDHDGLIDLASNDYLGLSRDQRLIEAAVTATRRWGTGSTGSRLVTGTTELHAELDERLSRFAGAPRALTFSSGYLANLAAVAALAGTLVVSDKANHASIIDACRLSRATVEVVPHRDVAGMERALDRPGEKLIVTDAVFSVDGDLAPLRELHALAVRHGALLVVDEAHSFGVVGEHGRGAVHQAGLAGSELVVRTVTLSKSLAAQGGAVLGAPEIIRTLIETGRSFIFDTGLAPAPAAAALAALDVIEAEPWRPGRARRNAATIARTARDLDLETGDPVAAVLPVILGRPETALRAREICLEHGVRPGCFRPPSVPEGRSCLRLTARANLTPDELKVIAEALEGVTRMAVTTH